jgi:hypothetical protein
MVKSFLSGEIIRETVGSPDPHPLDRWVSVSVAAMGRSLSERVSHAAGRGKGTSIASRRVSGSRAPPTFAFKEALIAGHSPAIHRLLAIGSGTWCLFSMVRV